MLKSKSKILTMCIGCISVALVLIFTIIACIGSVSYFNTMADTLFNNSVTAVAHELNIQQQDTVSEITKNDTNVAISESKHSEEQTMTHQISSNSVDDSVINGSHDDEYVVVNVDNDIIYLVKKGDTLSEISGMVKYSVDAIAKYNHIENVDLIYTGESLRIPVK